MKTIKVDILFLVDTGIGNALEMLYAVEYCLRQGKLAAIFCNRIAPSFVSYLRDCYGEEVVLASLDGVSTEHLIHSWLYKDNFRIDFKYYYYVNADNNSTNYLTETEQYLSIVKGIYPGDFDSKTLLYLKADYSDRVKAAGPEDKHVLYPGCDAATPSKRWPYFQDLIKSLGPDNVIVIGGKEDLSFIYSYYYPKWLTRAVSPFFLRRIAVFSLLKKLGILKPHANLEPGIERQPYSYFNVFTWPELVALLKRASAFIGNDGGITHLAGACDTPGFAIFGPSSVKKNRPYNGNIRPIATDHPCQPCQFTVNKRDSMSKNSILCPFQVRCLYDIKAQSVFEEALFYLKSGQNYDKHHQQGQRDPGNRNRKTIS